MSEHSSLTRPFAHPVPLRPQKTMSDPYKPCWCGSGKAWKRCHKNRDKQPPLRIGEHFAELGEAFQIGNCCHPDASAAICSGLPINAHTVQRRGGLAGIAEGGHVMSIKAGFERIAQHEGEIIPQRVGLKKASTFPGFCARHDAEMFRGVEVGKVELSAGTAFLLSFRALAYEITSKRSALANVPLQREGDRGASFEQQCLIQLTLHSYEHGLRRGISDMTQWKIAYDEAFRTGSLHEHRFCAAYFAGILPLVGCGLFHPEFDFGGNALQRLGRANTEYEHIAVNITVLDGRTAIVFGWMGEIDGPAHRFARSFAELPNHEKAEAVIRLAFEHLENIYLTPSWWESLPVDKRAVALARIQSGTMVSDRRRSCLLNDGVSYSSGMPVGEDFAKWS